MNKTIRKVLEELTKEKPDLSYIRGMLEVLADEPAPIVVPVGSPHSGPRYQGTTSRTESVADESTPIPDAARIGPVANLG